MKIYFKIKEGDFYKYRHSEIEDILIQQFKRLYFDNSISTEEAIHQVELQDLFDLSYDQFDEIKAQEVKRAIEEGASITDLDTTKYPKTGISKNDNTFQHVQDLVWNRDNGQCTSCGSVEQLEFIHLIPSSKGGSNTYRNIQLLCGVCKGKKIS